MSPEQLAFYEDLPGAYRARFGDERVCFAPIPDFHLADVSTLTDTILPFLAAADIADEPVVVHCSAGSGRTGHVLAAWLVFRHGMDPEQAAAPSWPPDAIRMRLRADTKAGAQKLYDLLAFCLQQEWIERE